MIGVQLRGSAFSNSVARFATRVLGKDQRSLFARELDCDWDTIDNPVITHSKRAPSSMVMAQQLHAGAPITARIG
ncbi:hypothetical protein [Ferrimicrobium acidiphilum]|uniref:hypothetical protein n=1 Tax=Ferrimicrobium acidiphilum TaxID=121039 RepID=UPI001269FC73|nr:hypothetical protein [Ferrimicrobium acidiphilum]